MKKKFLAMFTLAIMLAFGVAQVAWADEWWGDINGSCGKGVSWSFNKGTGTLAITGIGAMDDYDDSMNFSPWYYNKVFIKNIVFAETITHIGDNAFTECENLTKVSITKNRGNITIGKEAFMNCYNLKEVSLGKGVTSIGEDAFYRCLNLEKLTLFNDLVEIGDGAFYQCTNLSNVIIPSSIENWGQGVFDGSGLQYVIFENGL